VAVKRQPNIGRFVANVAGRVAPVASEAAGAVFGAIPSC